jgi:hypothetical protein
MVLLHVIVYWYFGSPQLVLPPREK